MLPGILNEFESMLQVVLDEESEEEFLLLSLR